MNLTEDRRIAASFNDWSNPTWNRVGLLQLMLGIVILPSEPENPTLALKGPKLKGDQRLRTNTVN
jgi:hypothetical protein